MKKIFFIIFFLSFTINSYGQYDWSRGELILKNGKTIKGLIKIPMESVNFLSIGKTKVLFKKNKKSASKKYGSDVIDGVIFGIPEFTTSYYKYVSIKKQKKVLLKVVVEGQLNLYTRTVSSSSSPFFNYSNMPNNMPNGRIYSKDSQFYVKRDNEQVGTLLSGPNTSTTFIYKAKKYFADCKDMIYYLENDLYDTTNLVELVEDYNLICN